MLPSEGNRMPEKTTRQCGSCKQQKLLSAFLPIDRP